MECTSVSERVKAYVVEKELSQKLIAKNMNISESRLSLMLNGKRRSRRLSSWNNPTKEGRETNERTGQAARAHEAGQHRQGH